MQLERRGEEFDVGASVDMYTHDGWWQGTVQSVQGQAAIVQLDTGGTWPARPDQLRCSLVWEDRSWQTVAGETVHDMS